MGVLTIERIVPKSLGSKVLDALKMAFSGEISVLKLLVTVVTVVFSQRHFFVDLFDISLVQNPFL